MCGGSTGSSKRPWPPRGLSPRVRGKLDVVEAGTNRARSIPACAGEAALTDIRPQGSPVYPRVCGGSVCAVGKLLDNPGLSPRVRGKRERIHHAAEPAWSIPACAGEAGGRRELPVENGVYPRVCGGSGHSQAAISSTSGLSPRVRGKPFAGLGRRRAVRSIPACAGEAAAWWCRRIAPEVYPRVCGGSPPARF